MTFEVSNQRTALTNSSANSRPGVSAIARSLRFALGLVFLLITAMTANAATFVVTNTNDTGPGSLRQALIDAGVQAGLDTVSFQIGTGPKTITLASDLPIVSNLVVIDATTQPGYAGAPIIEINGNHVAGFGLQISAGNSTVKGLVINNFNLSGINLRVNGNNTIANCYIGTSLDGMSSKGNAQSGISIEAGSSGNTIGGLLANLRNVISGNQSNGIQIAGDGGNFIEGNYIGTNAAGAAALGNGSYGIRVFSSNNSIGVDLLSSRNVISGNARGIGIDSSSSSNIIAANYVGLDASGTSAIPNPGGGVEIYGPNNTIGGNSTFGRNVISGNGNNGIVVSGASASGTLIKNNYIGTDANGSAALGNSSYAIRTLDVNGITIGGTTGAARNVVSGNGRGISIEGASSSGNVIQGNFIGVDVTGSVKIGNGESGIDLSGSNSLVGGTVPGAGNVIAGNEFTGIAVSGSGTTGNKIQGNMIGVDVTGTKAIANGTGVSIRDASNTLIGGTSPEARNIISGNFRGVTIDGTGTGNLVQGNYIGTDITGGLALGNAETGVIIGGAGNTVGGTAAGSRNVISGNGSGLLINGIVATGNLVQGNFIGTKDNGTDFLGNDLIGVQISNSYNNLIGGTVPGAGNIVAGNNYAGVVIDAGTGDAILGNSIYGNARLGIELSGEDAIGLNENDYADPDVGANWEQNYPLLTSVTVSGGNTSIQGKFNSNPNKQFRLEFFANNNCGSTGFGEGQTLIGSTSVTTDGSGDAVINATLPVTPAGQFITATATSAANDTSEFSPCALVGGANPGALQFESSFYLVEEFEGTATITVTRSSGLTGAVSVHYATSDGDATAPADYASTSGTLTFGDGEVVKTFTIPIVNDSDFNEQQESVHLTLSNPTGGATLGSQSTSDLLINYSDPTYPATSFSDATVVEGDNGSTNAVFTISVSDHSAPLTVGYATVPGLATSPADYQEKSGQLIFNPGENSKTVSVPVFGDSIVEGDETFYLNLTLISAGYTVRAQGQGLIIDDDGSSKLQFSSSAYSANEGSGSVTVTVTRTADTKPAVSVAYSTSDGTAKAGSDYTAAAGTLNFAAGETSKTFTVNITGDSQVEGDETLNLKLSNASAGAFLGGPSAAVLTINDNQQTLPGLSVSDVTLVEGNSGTTTFAFNVSLSAASAQNVRVDFATADGTAASGSDYQALNGSLTFNPGETSKTVNVLVNGDTQTEPDETFLVQLSNPANATLAKAQGTATITNDDSAQSQPTLSISDRTQAEGNSGATIFGFSVVLSAASAQAVTVNFATADGTAISGSDYQASSGSLTFNPSETSKTINVLVNGDATQEPAETFFVDLSGATNAGILKARGTATIVNDDNVSPVTSFQFAQPTYSVQEDSSALTLTVTRIGDTSGPASVDYTTVDGTATQKGDYEFAAGTLRFAANEVSQTFPVLINEDSYVESTEQFNLTLSNPTGAILGAQSTTTVNIADDAIELPANPIDDAENFVRMQYHDFLNREADPAGLAFWTNEITSCGPDQTCIDAKRINVSSAFFLSIEFQQTGYLVHRMYKASYGNLPGAMVPVHFDEFMRDAQEIRRDVVVNQPGWEQVLDNNRKAFIGRFVQRPRFTAGYPGTLTPAQFVDALFANAGLTPASADRQAAIAEFAGSLNSADDAARGRALQRVADDPTLIQQEFDRAFVLMQYFGYLRRNPNDAPEPGLNFDGCNFWVNKLNQFNSNYGNAEMVKSFLVSGEYRQRFGQ